MQSVYNGDFQNSPPVSSLLPPTYSLKKKKKNNLFQVTLNCHATETRKMVLKSPHSRIADGLDAASTIP